ncbi:hypothetical protein BGZ65_012720 [Modicella reniformis]|uniref:BAG domain-containing protein n=1 Tax=Modicella reniformis TaxID=1440133 RepID=A0A9P6LTR2_9FUNG|nr:hypothetical protein BGZ65_012720 [Modicella reniformis]
MKDNNAPLSSFGIKPNGVITMMGTKSSKSDIRTAPLTTTSGSGGDPEEHALVIEIQTSYKKILDLTDQHVPKYERAVKEYIQSNNPPSVMDLKNEYGGERPMRKWLLDEYTLLSEKLMQALLVLDSVICKPNFEVARAKRKEAVKETQRLLDLIDEMNARVKTYDETAEATGKL